MEFQSFLHLITISDSMKKINLSVPEPCSEKWQNFIPVEDGGFCAKCSKVVIDFTKMSDDEIISYFRRKSQNSCGRFYPEQLKTYTFKDGAGVTPGFALMGAAFISFIILFFGNEGKAQGKKEKVKIENTNPFILLGLQSSTISESVKARGIVLSSEDNAVMPGINVSLKGTSIKTFTDAQGQFIFPQPLEAGQTLIFEFIGYYSTEYTITSDSSTEEISVQMKPDMTMLGEIVVGGARTTRAISFRGLWWRLKRLFA
jgi:hypothetical protein